MPVEYNPDPSAGAIPPEEVARYLYEAGFRGEALLKMVAIGWRESRWKPTAHRSDRPKSELSGDLGLFQVNYTWFRNPDGSLKRDFLDAIGATGPADLFKPNIAARAAWLISRGGTSFGAWSVSTEPGVGWSSDGDPLNLIPSRIFEEARAAIANAGLSGEIAGVRVTVPTTTTPAQVSSPTTGVGPPQMLLPDWLNIETLEEALLGPRTPPPEYSPRAVDGVMANPNPTLFDIATVVVPPDRIREITATRPPATTTTTTPPPTTTTTPPTTTTTTPPATTTTTAPPATTTTVPGIREEFVAPTGVQGQSVIIDGGLPIPDDMRDLLRRILQPKYVLFLDGANPSTVTQEERNLLNNILRNFQYVDFTDPRFLAMLQLPDPNDSARATLQTIENARAAAASQEPSQIVLPDIGTLPTLPGEIPEPQGIQPGESATEFDPYDRLARPPATPSEFVAAPTTTGGTPSEQDGPPTDRVYGDLPTPETTDPFSEIYGYWWAIVNDNPELMNLIETAKTEKWGALEFQYQLEQTTWWKTTSDSAREFDVLNSRDPASIQARIDTVAEQIRQLALERNLRFSSQTLAEIARNSIRFGWSLQQGLNALGTEAMKSTEGVTALRYGFYGNKINEIAADYGVTISDTEFSELVNKFAVGKENEESLTASFQTKATALFPAIADRLMAGETFADIVDPYITRASNILQQDFAATDFAQNDNLAQAVTFVGEDGKQRPMTYTEWGNYLRSNRDFGYEYTDEAVGRAYQVANRIADLFGAI